MARHKRDELIRWRHRLYEILEQAPFEDHISRIVTFVLVALIAANIIALVLDTVPYYAERYHRAFAAIETGSLIIFTIEYLLRLWVAPEHTPRRRLKVVRARLNYATSGAGLIDLLAVLPFWIGVVTSIDLRFLLIFRTVRLLKLARYSPAISSLVNAVYSERRALFGCLILLIGTTLTAASLMHLVEGRVQPDKLGTMPDAMWWAIVTLGTIGYGDIVPVTALGKLVASVTIVFGLIMIALPVGVIANAFGREVHRRDFVVTWTMVARVPLFAQLEAGEIADVMTLLRAQSIEGGAVLMRRGEVAHSMYLIASGAVEIELQHERIRLGAGDFFGEIAVLHNARRSATVRTTARTNLLVLDAQDLHALMERQPRIAQVIQEVAKSRMNVGTVSPKGDLVQEEIAQGQAQAEPNG